MYSVLQLSQLIRNVWICGRIDSSSIIAHPIYTTGTIAKIRCQEVDISIIDRYNSFDNRYGFIVSNGNTDKDRGPMLHWLHLLPLYQMRGSAARGDARDGGAIWPLLNDPLLERIIQKGSNRPTVPSRCSTDTSEMIKYGILIILIYQSIQRSFCIYAPSQWETILQCNVASHWMAHTQNDPCVSHVQQP